MKITILNGSPREENTAAMATAFKEGAESAGHEVNIIHVGRMKIAGCMGCGHCRDTGTRKCIQRDDMDQVIPSYMESDMIVIASPIYYFGLTAQIQAAIQRAYCISKPQKAKQAVLMLSSHSEDAYEGVITMYKKILAYDKIEDAGIITAFGDQNKSESKMNEIREFAKNLKDL